MNGAIYVGFASMVVVAVVWMVTTRFRARIPLFELFDSIEAILPQRLYPFVEVGRGFVEHSDSQLWSALGGFRGLRRIHWQAGVLLSVGIALRRQCDPPSVAACNEIIWASLYLRFMVWACMLESLSVQLVPAIPRIQARSVARLYCNVVTGIEVLIPDDLQPGLGEA